MNVSSATPRIAGMMSASGMEAIEARVRQLESMMQAMEKKVSTNITPLSDVLGDVDTTSDTRAAFKNILNQTNRMDAAIDSAVDVTGGKPAATLKARIQQVRPLVDKFSAQYGVDSNLVNALIKQESGFNPAAVSSAGAQGLMQLMPATAKSLGVNNPLDAQQNLEGGIRHLKGLLDQYNGNIPLALAAYNAGSGAVKRHGGIPPYQETQNYVRSILGQYLAAGNRNRKSV